MEKLRRIWKQPRTLALGGVMAVLIVLFGPVLFGGRLFSGLYVNLYHYYFFDGQHFLIHTLGQWPNWWPAFASGYPISLTLDGFLNPIFVITLKFFPVIPAYAWLTFLFFVANIASMYALARALKLTQGASLVTAIAYGFSGIIIRWTDVIVFTTIFPLLPLAFLAVTNIHEQKKYWRLIWTLILAYGWIAGFSELMVYQLVATAGYAVYLMRRDGQHAQLKTFLQEGIKKYLLPVLASVLIVSPWLVSVLYFILFHSTRAGGISTSDASSMPITLSHLIHLFLPRLSVFYGDNVPVLRLGDDIDLYIGAVPLLLLFLLPFVWRKANKGWGFFCGLLAFALLMSFRSPIYLIVRMLPVLSWFRWHFKWSFLTVFAAAMLAGYAFDALSDFLAHRQAKRFTIALWGFLASAFVGCASLTLASAPIKNKIVEIGVSRYSASATTARGFARSADYYQWLISQMADSLVYGFSLLNPWTIFAFCLWSITLAILTLAVWKRLDLSKTRWASIGISLVGALAWTGFLVGEPHSYLTKEPATAKFLHEREAYQTVPVTSEEADAHIPYRVFPFFPSQIIAELQDKYRIELISHHNRAELSRELLDDNINTWFRTDGMFNHEPLTEKETAALFVRAIAGSATGSLSFQENVARFSSTTTAQELGVSNVKYVLSPLELRGPWKQVFKSSVINQNIPVFVYENPFFKPRWYFAGSDTKDLINLERYDAGELRVKTTTDKTREFIFTETGAAFWQATIDGSPVEITRVNTAYQSVMVPTGTHEIIFFYPGFWTQAKLALSRLLK